MAPVLLLQACGTSEVNDTTLDPLANRIANDLHDRWSLALGSGCTGTLEVLSTMAWIDVNSQTAGATGSGSWSCGGEGGPLSLRVTTQGFVEIALYRNGLPVADAWTGEGTYAPLSMSGKLGGADAPWSAHHQ